MLRIGRVHRKIDPTHFRALAVPTLRERTTFVRDDHGSIHPSPDGVH